MQKVFNVAVDIGRKLPAPAFEVNTNDLKSVKLIITITNGQTLLNLTDTTVRIAIRKPDNHIIFQDCTVKDATNGQVEIVLENQAYITPGTHTAEIMCYKGSEVVAVSGTFSYKSTKGIMNDEAVESKSEFTSISNMMKDVQDTIDDIRENGTGVDAKARQDIQSVTTQLVNKASKEEVRLKTQKISQTDVTEEFLQQMAGNTPINAIPADGTITPEKLSSSLQDIFPKSFKWELGSVLSGGGLSESSTRIRTPQVDLKAGTSISLSDTTNYKYAVHRFRYTDKGYLGQTGWITNPTTITEDVYGILIVARSDDSNLSQVIKETGNQLVVYGPQSVNAIKNKVEKNEKEVNSFKATYEAQQFSSRNIAPNGDFKNGTTGWTTVAATATINNGEVKLTPTGNLGRIYVPLTFNANDIIYRTGLIKTTSNKVGIGGSSVLFKAHSGSGQYERVSDARMYNQYYMSVVDTRTSGWDDVYAKNLMAINLTQTFGAGKEPTAAEMDKLLSKFPNGWIESDVSKPLLDLKEVYFNIKELNKPKNPLDAFIKAIAHRGYSSVAPENTLPAYRLAKEKGFSYVEADIIFSADGVGMVTHLDDLSITTNGTGLVSESQLSYLKTLDAGSWKNPTYAGTKMPTFDEFITLCKRLNLHPYIEVKKATTAQIGILVNQCKLKGMLRNVTWIGALEFLNIIKGLDEYARLGWVGAVENLSDSVLTNLIGLKNGKNKVFANLDQATLTREVVERCINQGLDVETWTVNNEQKVLTLSEWGVIGITTDGLNVAEILINQ